MRRAVTIQYHPIGTVAMGPKGQCARDEHLVSSDCKGLRVVDVSFIPLNVSVNLVSVVYAIIWQDLMTKRL